MAQRLETPPPHSEQSRDTNTRDPTSSDSQHTMFTGNQETAETDVQSMPPPPSAQTPMRSAISNHSNVTRLPPSVLKLTGGDGADAEIPSARARRHFDAIISTVKKPPVSPPFHRQDRQHRQTQTTAGLQVQLAPDSNTTSSTISSPAGTPFRFSSFPASLPRVTSRSMDTQTPREQVHIDFNQQTPARPIHHEKTPFQSPFRNISESKPGTVRKRMTFAESEFINDGDDCYPAENDCSDYINESHNTSLSSLSADGATNFGIGIGVGKTPVRMNNVRGAQTPCSSSLGFRGDVHQDADADTDADIPASDGYVARTSREVWLSPILSSDEKQKSTGSGSSSVEETTGGDEDKKSSMFIRTRLNFNTLFSPVASSDSGDRKRHSLADEFRSPHEHDGK